jgi:acetyl-CoA acetyltransferase
MAGEKQAAIVGIGFTPFSRASEASTLGLAVEACRNAILDAGVTPDEIDGIATFALGDSVPALSVATGLGLGTISFGLDLYLGGQAPAYLVGLAAQAVTSGSASAVLVYRAMKGRSGQRVGRMPLAGLGTPYRYPIGFTSYPMYVGMWGQRFLHETGQGEEDMAAVVAAQREYARNNERAIRRDPITLEAYLEEPFVVEPFRRSDCTAEIDGACALLITTLERARDLAHPPAVVAASEYAAGARSGLDMGDLLLWPDYSRNYTSHLADRLFDKAGVARSDVDVAQIYDCFSTTVLVGLEGLGLVGRGESGAFVRSGETALNGSLPTNTGGGLLSEGYLHGMNVIAEAAAQIQQRGGDRQVADAEVCVATSGALMDGSALILTADR